MSENTTPSVAPANNQKTVQKKKSFRHKKSSTNLNRNKKSSSNLKVKPLEQIDDVEKQKKVNSDKIPKNQVNKENKDNNKPEVEKKEVDKKKKYYKKKSMSDLKKDDSKSDTVSEAKSDVTSSTNEKPNLKKAASKQFKKKKSKANLKDNVEKEKVEDEQKESEDIMIKSFITLMANKRIEMEKEEEELINNPPQNTKSKKPATAYTKANKPKKEIPQYDDDEIKKVLDCYDFPTSFKTHNLLEMFSDFKGKFRINWINDSRALFIFDTEETARAALLSKINEKNYVIKPYENPNSDSSSSYSLNDPKISAINILKNIL